MPLVLFEVFLQVFVVAFVVTQVLVPVLRDRPLFPVFRWRKSRHEMAETIDAIEHEKFDAEIRKQTRKLHKDDAQ